MPIVWQSKCIRRVIKITLGVETLTISEACLFDRKLLLELQQQKDETKNTEILWKKELF